MDLRRAGNQIYQRFATHQDVKEMVALLLKVEQIRGPIAAFLRDLAGKEHQNFDMMLAGLRIRLIASQSHEQAQTIANLLKRFYEDSQDDEEVDRKRGMVLEVLVHSIIKAFYKPGKCMMQCHAFHLGKQINFKEVDVCAWSDSKESGEAYECKTNPFWLEAEHCLNLVGILQECEHYAHAFRLGAVSLESADEVEYRLDALDADRRILPFGWDNLDDLCEEPEPIELLTDDDSDPVI